MLTFAQALFSSAGEPSSQLMSDIVPILAITLGCGVGVVAIIGGVISSILRTRSVEHTRRELSAYVAEGSMTPDDAGRILAAGKSAQGCGRRRDA